MIMSSSNGVMLNESTLANQVVFCFENREIFKPALISIGKMGMWYHLYRQGSFEGTSDD